MRTANNTPEGIRQPADVLPKPSAWAFGHDNMRKNTPSLKMPAAVKTTRIVIGKSKCCYVLSASKKIRYKKGRSRIVYFGTTKNGVARIAESVAHRSRKILRSWGVTSFHAYIVTCRPRKKKRSWLRLEGSLITTFKEMFGERPKCNRRNGKPDWDLFRQETIKRIIEDLS